METALLILRIILIVLGSLTALIYLLLQLFQRVQPFSLSLSTVDYIVYTVVALLFGFGTNNYYGLLAFVPLLLVKLLCRFTLKPQKLAGSGRWMEVDWKKLMPKGFERILPPNMFNEMNKMPKDAHFVIPRFYLNIFIFFMRKRMNAEMGKNQGQFKVSATQQNMAMGQFTDIINSISNLQSGQTERKNFPFGMLKITRL